MGVQLTTNPLLSQYHAKSYLSAPVRYGIINGSKGCPSQQLIEGSGELRLLSGEIQTV